MENEDKSQKLLLRNGGRRRSIEVCFTQHTGKLVLAECPGHKFLDPEKKGEARKPTACSLVKSEGFQNRELTSVAKLKLSLYHKVLGVHSAIALSCLSQL